MEKRMRQITMYMLVLILTGVCVLVDQGTKYLAVLSLKGKDPFVLIDNVLEFSYVENRGAAFGLFQNRQVIFIIFSVIVAILVVWMFVRVPLTRHFLPLRICGILLLAGAIGNCIDRLRLNYVVDFIYIKLIDFPVFNVADMYVTVTLCLLIILLIFYYKEEDFDQILDREK